MPSLALLSLLAAPADAHGLWGHIHVTGWAVENMPDDELRAFLLEPEVFNALLFGAVFTDTGYARDEAASRAYAEHTHWEPFVEDYIQWIRENDPPPWDDLESRKRVAFLLGCASHGLQDSIFDSLFLYQVEHRDGAGQNHTDPGTDGFLVIDEHIRFIPEQDIPMSTVLELYEVLPEEVTQEVIERAVELTVAAYINEEIGLSVARTFGERYADEMPWGRLHYMDPAVPGSLRAEIFPTMRYQRAVWDRLHQALDPDEVMIFAYPEAARRLRSGDASTPDAWVTLLFGEGVAYAGAEVELVDDAGDVVPFTLANTRWGAAHTRLMRLLPEVDLTPGGWYTARLKAGALLIGGGVTTRDHEVRFQVACLDDDDPLCPALEEAPVASIDGLAPEDSGDSGLGAADPEGCGCAAGGAAGGWLAALAALAARRRRGGLAAA